ncbi:MAG: HD domain-containing protein [Candidatus Omnitrophica bacterium]|nr:HD domain-containing protein [Candidatus Omnitrophota bacterium]MDD5512414.1 HD domain-containing protein [Candidatus Omnitrophota bacterium]
MNTKNYLTPTKKYKILSSAVHSIYRLINSTFELKDLVSRLSRLICQLLNCSSCEIILLDNTKTSSILKCTASGRKKFIIEKKTKLSGNIENRIARTLTSVRKNTILGMPLISEDIIGMVIVRRNLFERPFDSFDQELLITLSEQAIIGIKNFQLYEEQQKIVFGSIKSLVTLLDIRVPQEYTHSPYFSRLVVAIAHQMHLDDKQVESLKYASLLHDTGKVDIPMEILTKSGKLTDQEFSIIKTHPVKGAQILRPFQILKPVIPIIMHHHEKYDGTGYPSRLKKGQIPLGARIMAVADAFEAMVYGRPYRERVAIDAAIREIKKKSGTQFDPKVVDAFLKVIKKFNTKKYLRLLQ